MTINTENLVSITETNQNFSRVARMVDRTGAAVVLKNNVPRYVILDFNQLKEEETASASEALASARKLLKKHLPAFKDLAK
ncbi:MAG: type II toxin-antitoxin system Phd/YefM family antitoxin [Lachnoclostridium sp.]|jgi:antitoxin Phd|nr:type II toxin-antitoxin system Phd/YefM family antitoxin [Lachnoclostridium sp.]